MFTDVILNGKPSGETAQRVAEARFDPGIMRPYLDEKGRAAISVNTGRFEPIKDRNGEIVYNESGEAQMRPVYEKQLVNHRLIEGLPVPYVGNATTLRKDQWIHLDNVVLTAARKRLRAWADLRSSNTYGGFDAMANPILEYETVSDPGEAVVDMDAMSEGRNFSPQFALQGLPLPITHSDFWLSKRFLAASQGKGMPADTIRAELAGRRVAEMIEQTVIGTVAGTTYGASTDYGQTSQVYGYLTHPNINTKTNITAPTGSNGTTVLIDWLACREQLYGDNFFGPFMVYVSSDYDQYLDNLFSTTEPSAGTLRSRLLQIDGVQGIRRLDYLPSSTNPFTMIWVQMTPDVARAINGMEITTVQWESMGGMRVNFKVMAIQVPQLRADYNGNMGVLVATTS